MISSFATPLLNILWHFRTDWELLLNCVCTLPWLKPWPSWIDRQVGVLSRWTSKLQVFADIYGYLLCLHLWLSPSIQAPVKCDGLLYHQMMISKAGCFASAHAMCSLHVWGLGISISSVLLSHNTSAVFFQVPIGAPFLAVKLDMVYWGICCWIQGGCWYSRRAVCWKYLRSRACEKRYCRDNKSYEGLLIVIIVMIIKRAWECTMHGVKWKIWSKLSSPF